MQGAPRRIFVPKVGPLNTPAQPEFRDHFHQTVILSKVQLASSLSLARASQPSIPTDHKPSCNL